MGGIGSGRSAGKPSIEASINLSLRAIASMLGTTEANSLPVEQVLTWSHANRLAFATGALLTPSVEGSAVLMLQPRVQDWFAVEPIALVSTPQPRGGRRWWFRCPECSRRCRALFVAERRWRCRRCAGLTYQSSRASDKRLGPLLREIEHVWRSDKPLNSRTIDTGGGGEQRSAVAAAQAALPSTLDLRLQLRAQRLALKRLLEGKALYRSRARRQAPVGM